MPRRFPPPWSIEEKGSACFIVRDHNKQALAYIHYENESGPVVKARYGWHMLRHAAASLFIQHFGWTPTRAQTVMGHSSINTTFDLYGYLFEDLAADREDMKKIEAAIVAA